MGKQRNKDGSPDSLGKRLDPCSIHAQEGSNTEDGGNEIVQWRIRSPQERQIQPLSNGESYTLLISTAIDSILFRATGRRIQIYLYKTQSSYLKA